MPVKIIVPTPMQRYTMNKEEVAVGGATVDHALQHLAENYPDIRKHLFNEDGTLRAFVNVYVNDEDSRLLAGGSDAGQRRRHADHCAKHRGRAGRGGHGRVAVVPSGAEP